MIMFLKCHIVKIESFKNISLNQHHNTVYEYLFLNDAIMYKYNNNIWINSAIRKEGNVFI